MDLLKTLLVYMSLVFTTSVQNAPEPSYIPEVTPTPTAYVEVTPTPSPKPTPVPTINITPNPAYKTVQTGDNGDLVRQLQEKLAEYGYYEGEIDGRFGNQTRRAVEAFQYQHGLSADGIAGRHTLTVLYESSEIRMAPQSEPEATATPVMQLAAALTPEPTNEPAGQPAASPAFAPVETAAPTAVPAAEAIPRITAEPAPALEAMEGWVIRVESTQETAANAKGETLVPCKAGDAWYLPIKEVLTAGYLNVISSSSIEMDEFAFAMGDAIIRVAYTANQAGEPDNVEAFINGEPQIMKLRDIRSYADAIYLPVSTIESLTGMTCSVDESSKTVAVLFPEAE